MNGFVISGITTRLVPKAGLELSFDHEIAEVDGRPMRCFFTWDTEIEVRSAWDGRPEDRESGVLVVGKKKRIVRTEPLTAHEAIAWRRAQQVSA